MRKYRHIGVNRTDFYTLADWINAREAFRGGAFAGYPIEDAPIGTGKLYGDQEWSRTFTARRNVGVIDYVIYSYATPIAWHDTEAGWIQPDIRYSVTTTRHQSATAVAIAAVEAYTFT